MYVAVITLVKVKCLSSFFQSGWKGGGIWKRGRKIENQSRERRERSRILFRQPRILGHKIQHGSSDYPEGNIRNSVLDHKTYKFLEYSQHFVNIEVLLVPL